MKHSSRITDATAIDSHFADLSFDFGQIPSIGVAQYEGASGAGGVLTSVALFAIGGCAMFDDFNPFTLRAMDWF